MLLGLLISLNVFAAEGTLNCDLSKNDVLINSVQTTLDETGTADGIEVGQHEEFTFYGFAMGGYPGLMWMESTVIAPTEGLTALETISEDIISKAGTKYTFSCSVN